MNLTVRGKAIPPLALPVTACLLGTCKNKSHKITALKHSREPVDYNTGREMLYID